jgi:hypothetical protein
MHYFDFETVARKAGIPADKLEQLVKYFTQEEPYDLVLAELHLLRACMAIQNGQLTLDEALSDALNLAA